MNRGDVDDGSSFVRRDAVSERHGATSSFSFEGEYNENGLIGFHHVCLSVRLQFSIHFSAASCCTVPLQSVDTLDTF